MRSAPRYKTPAFQQTYEAMLAAARDPSSELYYNGAPHRGAGHRAAFWDGYAGLARSANVVPGTLSSVCFAAGRRFAKTHPGLLPPEPIWQPGQPMDARSTHERIADADTRARAWRARAQEFSKAGKTGQAQHCEAKSRFWLDRITELRGGP